MKLSSFFVCLFTILCNFCIKSENLEEIDKSCIKELGIDDFMVDYNLNQLYLPENNQEFSKFIECVWKKKEFISSTNDFQYDLLIKFISERYIDVVGNHLSSNAFAHDSVHSCSTVKGNTIGGTAIMILNCVTRLIQS
ncbi:hypothetical protein FQA39_LY11745 [Lamprigera yunnana]|nr:hypothetical protein FQA39_LY11745 [Lamprigera yunnana]